MENLNKELAAFSCGEMSSSIFAVINGEKITPSKVTGSLTEDGGMLQVEYGSLGTESLTFTRGKDSGGAPFLTCRRVFRTGNAVIRLTELGLELKGIRLGGDAAEDYFYNNENPRIYNRMIFPVDFDRTRKGLVKDSEFDETAGNKWADPGVVCERIGRSPYQTFPAILLGNLKKNHGLVHGTLSQNVFFHNYRVFHEADALTLQIFSGFKEIEALECSPGRILADEHFIGVTDHAEDLEKIFSGYTEELRKHLPPMYGASRLNRDWVLWDSWNDGILWHVSEEMLLKEARFLKKHFPTVRWFQLDDGYAAIERPAHGIGVPFEGEAGIHHEKFPHGLRHFTDEVRKIGLRPAIWIGGFCPLKNPIGQQHPEWFIDYSYRCKTVSPLDVSIPEVREYMTKALDTLILEYGFDAVKHDFWSYAFEDSHDLLKFKDRSGYEWREWWLAEFRKRLPADGYLQTGCDLAMGNPFHGKYFTNYRYGIDVCDGNWEDTKTCFLWCTACLATHTTDLIVANSDSIGMLPKMSDTDAAFRVNFVMATRTMVELSGKLSEADPGSPRFKRLKRALCNPNNGQEVFFADYDYRDPARFLPRVIYFKTGHFCNQNSSYLPLRTAGVFNVEDEARPVRLTPAMLGLEPGKYELTEIWTGESLPLSEETVLELPPHGSGLYSVSRTAGLQLLNADIRVLSFDGKYVETGFGGRIELVFSREIRKILLNGRALPFTQEEDHGNYRITFTTEDAVRLEILPEQSR